MKNFSAGGALKQAVLFLAAVMALIPTAFMIMTSLKSDEEYALDKLGLPSNPVIENFRAVLTDSPFLGWMANSALLVTGSVAVNIVVSCAGIIRISPDRQVLNARSGSMSRTTG